MVKVKKPERLLLKISGEALFGEKGLGIGEEALGKLVDQLARVVRKGIEMAVVVGGGNICRGAGRGLNRVTADQMGMLATIINALALQSELEGRGIESCLQSAVAVPFAKPLDQREAIRALERGLVVIFAGGTGNPFVTTDTAAALRASDIEANLLLKATKVDGIYSGDPCEDKTAEKIDKISYKEVIERELKIMDLPAIDICRKNGIPIVVFDIFKEGNLERIINGERVGTLVTASG